VLREFLVILINQGRRRICWSSDGCFCGGGLMRNSMCLGIEMSKSSFKKRVSKRGLGEFVVLNNLKGKMPWWLFEMEYCLHLEQIDRKRMRSRSLSNRCDIRLRRSLGRSDQSASAMDAALLLFSNVK
jgi:hypothetical protein